MTKAVLTQIGAKRLLQETLSCWSCGSSFGTTTRAAHFCESCGKVQPPVPVDYFSFFGLPLKLNIDVAALEKDFYGMSRKLHPDLSAGAGREEQEWSLEQSSMLNDAYRTLKDPTKRTQYLLHLEGVELEEQSKSATEKARATGKAKKQIVPPDLLEEVFELNMQLEEARKIAYGERSLDGHQKRKLDECDPDLLDELTKQKVSLEAKYEALLDELKSSWKEWDAAIDRGDRDERISVRDKMVDVLNRRNYIRNLVRDVNDVLES